MSDHDEDSTEEDARHGVVTQVLFPKKMLIQFIKMYEKMPCLWDRYCVAYKQRSKRHEAITKLTEFVRKYDPTATRVHVLRKLESLRACVRREHKRVLESRRSATHESAVYVPNLWYYDMFSFLFARDEPKGVPAPMKSQYWKIEVEPDDDAGSYDVSYDEGPSSFPPFEQSLSSEEYNVASSMVEVSERSQDAESSKRQGIDVADEYDAIGINVAAKLRNLPMNMRILAEKLINDVLFQAQVNGLTSATSISTPDPVKTEP